MRRFSLYLHIPYCRAKCPYCDFNSYAVAQWPEQEYASALVAEMGHHATRPAWRGAVQTIFFGGGTPSVFAPETIAVVLAAVRRLWPAESIVDASESGGGSAHAAADSLEVTIEANPGTVTRDSLSAFRAAGVTRISFGVQSFAPRQLARLGRIHGRDEALAAIALARAAGFENIGLDLIFAVPGQDLDEWEADLRTALALGPDHIAAYNLTFEEGTPFHTMRSKGELRRVSEETEVAMFTRTQALLGAAGYAQYEISNYARPGRECRHNLNYWRGGAYLGVGAGAHSFSRDPAPGLRWSNENDPGAYIRRVQSDGHARVSEEKLTVAQAQGEFVFLGLRVRDGFAAADFAHRFGIDFLDAFPHAAALQRDGLLLSTGPRWRLSDRGLLLADSVFATFL